jgi:Rrf2 family protein
MWRFLTRTGEYALRAAIHVASQPEGRRVSASEMARVLVIPEKYLARVLAVLARSGVLESARGVKGGFRLARPASAIMLADVVEPFETVLEHPQCLTRPGRCDPGDPCAAHGLWKEATGGVAGFFRDTTLAALVA